MGESSPAFWARLLPHVLMRTGMVFRTASGEKSPVAEGEEQVLFPPWLHMGMAFIAVKDLQPGHIDPLRPWLSAAIWDLLLS